jgi:hypothetical protein
VWKKKTLMSAPVTLKYGVLHRKHPLIRVWRSFFVVLDQFALRYYDDYATFAHGKQAVGTIPLKGAAVFRGGQSLQM